VCGNPGQFTTWAMGLAVGLTMCPWTAAALDCIEPAGAVAFVLFVVLLKASPGFVVVPSADGLPAVDVLMALLFSV